MDSLPSFQRFELPIKHFHLTGEVALKATW
jgi:hypothetical protein